MAAPPALEKTPLEPLEAKAQPVPSTDAMALDSDIDGNANQYDALFEDAPQTFENGDHSVHAGSEPQPHVSENGTTPAPDPTTHPITDVVSGIAPTAPFLQDQPTSTDSLLNLTDAAVPTALPPSIEQPTSDVRDDTPSIPQPQAPHLTGATESSVAAETETKQSAAAAGSSFADVMDTSEDVAPSTETADLRSGDAQTTEVPAADAATNPLLGGDQESEIVTTVEPAGSTPAPEAQSGATQETEAPSSGKVRSREDDDESEPSAKRTKTDDAVPEFKVPELPAASGASTATGTNEPPPTPAAPSAVQSVSYDSSPMTKAQRQYIVEKLRQAKKIQAARPFLAPVDPVALNIPRYPEIIKNPMDIGTMEQKLKQEQYASADAFMDDFNLMIQNCFTFNGSGHPVTVAGQNLKAYFDKLMSGLPKGGDSATAAVAKKPKKPTISAPVKPAPARRESRASAAPAQSPRGNAVSPQSTFALDPNGVPLIRRDSTTDGRPKREIHRPAPRDLPYSAARPKKKKYQMELKFCQHVLDEIFKNRYRAFSYPFLVPVDPVALNIPQYHKIIKKPMDLGTIQTQLKAGFYTNAKEFQADVKLVFDNCYKFNPETDDVHKMGKMLENLFKELWAEKDTWISDHAPPSEPQSPATAYSDDEDESEEEEAEPADETKNQLLAIQQQIAALNAQTQKILQQKETASARKSSPKASSKKASKVAPKTSNKMKRSGSSAGVLAKPTQKKKAKNPILTFDQKQEVSEGIQNLGEADMRKAVQIIRNGIPRLKGVNDDELELDIEEIPDDALYELYRFVRSVQGAKPIEDDEYEPPARTAPKASTSTGKRKNKPMNAQEQESKIAAIREQLGRFQHGSGSESPAEAAQQGEQSSSDDDESASESEEE